jgi:hypothetical protein
MCTTVHSELRSLRSYRHHSAGYDLVLVCMHVYICMYFYVHVPLPGHKYLEYCNNVNSIDSYICTRTHLHTFIHTCTQAMREGLKLRRHNLGISTLTVALCFQDKIQEAVQFLRHGLLFICMCMRLYAREVCMRVRVIMYFESKDTRGRAVSETCLCPRVMCMCVCMCMCFCTREFCVGVCVWYHVL